VIPRRKRRDPVSPELVTALFARDIGCVLSFLDEGHVCTDHWGEVTDWRNATVEHVHEGYGMKGIRAKSDLDHTVLLCAGSNIGVPSKRERGLIRKYLVARRAA